LQFLGLDSMRVDLAKFSELYQKLFDVDYFGSVPGICPSLASVASFLAEHDFVYVVEQNRDGQLRSLIVNENGIDPVRLIPILHYDGTPITARFIAQSIGEHLATFKVTPLRKVVS